MNRKRVLLVVCLAMLIGSFFLFDLHRVLTLEELRTRLAELTSWRDAAPIAVGGAFLALYVVVTGLSLPGAHIMTLAAGALFGVLWGTVIVAVAAPIGATLAFMSSRYLLRDAVQARFGDRLRTVEKGIERDGAQYLFILRLVPVFPYFVINLLMGLTPIRVWTFYWVSQIGMFAGTLLYVNAGTQLARISDLPDVLSPRLLVSFALLGAFPLAVKSGIGWWRRRRVYARWKRPRLVDRNLIVIGAGSAGLVTAYIGAASRAKVTLVEANKMGGDCLNYGCVPSKTLIRSAKLAHQIRHADRYGLEPSTPQLSFSKVMQRVQAAIRQIEPHDSVERYTALGVEVLRGYARILDPWTVEVKCDGGDTRRLTTRSIVIAAGAEPFVPALPGLDEVGYVTSDTVWERFANLQAPPARLLVLGGGPIGCELAQCFARLGSSVTQVQHAPRLLTREDAEIGDLARASLEEDGVTVLMQHEAVRCERERGRKFIVVEHAGAERRIEFDALLCAVGRVPRLTGYGLEELGIPTERTVVVNEYLETLYPNIYAAGDVAGPYQFTHTAAHQAWYAAVNALFGHLKRFKADYSVVPWTTFLDPEIARVGLSEQEARDKGIPFEVTKYDLGELDRAITDGSARGVVKILTVPRKDRILGVTIVAEHAGELLAEFVLAMRHGLGLNKILRTIHTYPTLAEANKHAAAEWRRAHLPQRLLPWLDRYHAWRRA